MPNKSLEKSLLNTSRVIIDLQWVERVNRQRIVRVF